MTKQQFQQILYSKNGLQRAVIDTFFFSLAHFPLSLHSILFLSMQFCFALYKIKLLLNILLNNTTRLYFKDDPFISNISFFILSKEETTENMSSENNICFYVFVSSDACILTLQV